MMQHRGAASFWGSLINRSHDPFQINGVSFCKTKPGLLTMSISVVQDESELEEAMFTSCRVVQQLLISFLTTADPSELDMLIYQVTKLFHLMRASTRCTDEILEAIGISLTLLQNAQNSSQESSNEYRPGLLPVHSKGRPRLDVSSTQLEYLLRLGFCCPQIASILGVSLSTIRRRMTDFNLSVSSAYSQINDHELDVLVADIKHTFPNCGYRLMHGHLLNQGHRVTQMRIRDSLHRVDPDGSVIRWASTIQRRKYRVSSPLSLWHLDGNHKLIR